MGEQARAELAGTEQVAWVEGIESDHENLSEALRTLFAGRADEAAELAAALWPFYYQRGYYAEAREWYAQALVGADALPASILIDVLLKSGEAAFLQCDYAEATHHLQRVLPLLSDSASDRRAQALVRQRLGSIAREQARYDEARELHAQSLATWEAVGEPQGVASSQNYLGFVAWLSGDFAGAESACLPALAAFRAAGNQRDVAARLVSLGAAALYGGDTDLAAEQLSEALAISRRIGFQEQPRDRGRAVHQPQHSGRARLQHPAQAAGQAARRRRGARAPAGPAAYRLTTSASDRAGPWPCSSAAATVRTYAPARSGDGPLVSRQPAR